MKSLAITSKTYINIDLLLMTGNVKLLHNNPDVEPVTWTPATSHLVASTKRTLF